MFIFSSLFLIGLIINYIIFMVVITKGFFDFYLPKSDKKNYSKELESAYRNKNERYLKIFSTIKQNSTSGVWILALIATKDMLLPLVLIYAIDNPILQLAPIILFFGFILIFLIISRPYDETIETVMAIFNSSAYIIVLLTFGMLEILKDSLSEATKYNIVGHLIILFFSITVGANLLVGFVSSIIAFRDLGRAYIWGKKTKDGKDAIGKGEKEPDLDDSSIKGLNQIQQEPKNKFKKKPKNRKIKILKEL